MKLETQLSIQALIDGELSDAKRREVERLLAADAGAKALHAELANTVGALRDGELARELPESREFFWSKVADEIEAAERSEARSVRSPGAKAWWTRLLAPLGAAAALVVAFTVFQSGGPQGGPHVVRPGVETVADTELELPNSVTLHLFQEDATVIWVDTTADLN